VSELTSNQYYRIYFNYNLGSLMYQMDMSKFITYYGLILLYSIRTNVMQR
jgi:hypothetical protein